MPEIKSSLSAAQQHATRLKSASDRLQTSQAVSQDTQTTLAGNSEAQRAIATTRAVLSAVSQALQSASDNLHSVARDFAAVDEEQAKKFGLRGDM